MRRFALALALVGFVGTVQAASHAPPAPARTAAEVIERNVAARGGLEAWRKVETLVWLGHVERASSKEGARVAFVMQLKRPNLTRFELKEQFNQFTRIFDGTHGWKIRPAGDGRPESKSFSPEEVQFARAEFVVDGPLIDYQAKGVTAELDGLDNIEGHKAYRLSLRLPSGAERKVWIDLATNLELRYDRPATNPLVAGKPVSVYYRNYQSIEGLQIPLSIEVGGSADKTAPQAADKLIIEHVLVNPKLEDGAFLPPPVPIRHGGKIHIPGAPGSPGPGPGPGP